MVRIPRGSGPPHCRGCEITPRHTAVGRTPLDEWSAPSQKLLPDNTQHSQEIRTRSPCQWAVADPRLRPRRQWV